MNKASSTSSPQANPAERTETATGQSDSPSASTSSVGAVVLSLNPNANGPIAESVGRGFPIGSLPAVPAALVLTIVRCMRLPAELAAIAVLAVNSACIGAGLQVRSGPNRKTRANAYYIGSAEPTSGKSEVLRIVLAPMLERQREMTERYYAEEKPELDAQLCALGARRKGIESLLAKTGLKAPSEQERQELLAELKSLERQITVLKSRLGEPQLLVQDVTSERLAGILHRNREQAFSVSGDGRKVVDNLRGRYLGGGMTDEGLQISAYTGDYISVDRQTGDPIRLFNPLMNQLLLVQRDKLTEVFTEEGFFSGGLVSRILACDTQARMRRIEGVQEDIPQAVLSAWRKHNFDLLDTYHSANEPFIIQATPEAFQALTNFHNQLVGRTETDLLDVINLVGRWSEHAWRLSVALHAALHGREAHLHDIALETAQHAIVIVDWFSEQQLGIVNSRRFEQAQKLYTQVLEQMARIAEQEQRHCIRARDVYRAGIASDAEAAEQLLSQMEKEKILILKTIRPERGGHGTNDYYRNTKGQNEKV